MEVTWILVANASEARLFSNLGPGKGLQLMKEYSHPESREKVSDLVSDRPGHNQTAGNGHGAYVSPADPKQQEAERFARLLTQDLEQGRTGNQYEKLVLVASPHFLGLLNGHLNGRLGKLVLQRVEKDYTKEKEKELAGHLKTHIRI